jgi:serine phosphatase RsbU (regulator of sigma subunit)/tetratricopeptide (TPR) repeat protein
MLMKLLKIVIYIITSITIIISFAFTQKAILYVMNHHIADTTEVKLLLQKAEREFINGDTEPAFKNAQQAYQNSLNLSYYSGIVKSSLLLGKMYRKSKDYTTAFDYYLMASGILKKEKDFYNLFNTYCEIGFMYQEKEDHLTALQYLKDAYNIASAKENQFECKAVLESLALSNYRLQKYKEAIQYYEILLGNTIAEKDEEDELSIRKELITLYKLDSQYQEAIKQQMAILEIHKKYNNGLEIAQDLNDLGYLYKATGDEKKAVMYYQNALLINQSLYDKDKNSEINNKNIDFAINTALVYTNMKQYNQAETIYLKALSSTEANGNLEGSSKIYNYLAANYLLKNEVIEAKKYALKAEKMGETQKNDESLVHTYQVLAKIYAQSGEKDLSDKYEKLHQNLKQTLENKKIEQQRILFQNQLAIEQKENEFKLLLAEKEKNALTVKQNQLEAEKREKDLELQKQALVLKERELTILKANQARQALDLKNQMLEKERITQLLAITQQKAKEGEQKQAIDILEKNKRIQQLALEQKTVEEKKRKQELELSEKNRKLQNVQLKEEANLRKYGIWIIALMSMVIALVLTGFIINSRQKKKLKEQKYVIEEKNEELLASEEEIRQNMEELQTTHEALEEKTDLLHVQNSQIMQSIHYASNIQQALLPRANKLGGAFDDYFIFFAPRDVVSGDFYWMAEVENQIFVAVVDCTGHGIPGAFMSMIGNTLLHEIVTEKKIFSPSLILENLHKGVFERLQQATSGNKDGMDITLFKIIPQEDDVFELTFAAAKHSAFVMNGSLTELEGTRRNIGGDSAQNTPFEEKIVTLKKGDKIYMTSDGLLDTPNPKRRKFGKNRLVEFIEKHHHLSLSQQKDVLEETVKDFSKGTPQRDDILLIGLQM